MSVSPCMALFGNAHTVNPGKAQQDYARLLGHGEQVHAAFLLIRDTILFTDRRLILIDKQGITGKKVESDARRATIRQRLAEAVAGDALSPAT